MELVVDVDEIDIPRVKLDQEAVITLDALPDTEFQGTVTAIYPVPKEEGGVVLYEVRLSLDIPEDSGIKVGMSASADVMIEKRSDVLLVPSRAVRRIARAGRSSRSWRASRFRRGRWSSVWMMACGRRLSAG